MKFRFISSFLIIFCYYTNHAIDAFIHPSNNRPLSRNAPIVIADECLRLNKKLKDVRENKAGIVLFDYVVESKKLNISVDTMKSIYQHSKHIADIQSYIQEKSIYRIINFSYDREKYLKVEKRYNQDVQYINILRAFVTGMYMLETPLNSTVLHTWDNLEKVNRIISNKYKLPTNHFQDLFFFSNNPKLYKNYMQRNDSLCKESFDTSRHLLMYEDLYFEKYLSQINQIKNPIALKITGKIRLQKIIAFISVLQSRDEIVLIFSFHRLLSMRRLIPKLMKQLHEKDLIRHNINICFEVNSYNKSNYSGYDIDKDIDFIYMIKK